MKRRWWILIAVVGIAAGWLFFRHSGEPRYQGQPLSYWFKEYCRVDPELARRLGFLPAGIDTQKAAADALRHIGTNALPYLVELAYETSPDSTVKTNFMHFVNRLPRWLGLPVMLDSFTMRRGAASAIAEIRPPAGALLPLLGTRFNSADRQTLWTTILLLGTPGEGGEAAVPYLVAAMKDTNRSYRISAMSSLRSLGSKADAAVPALLELMNGLNSGEARFAAGTLGSIGRKASPATPLLRETFTMETNWSLKCQLAVYLCQIDAGQTEALDFLMDGLKDHHPENERNTAAMRLGEIGPNARAAAPSLINALSDTNMNSQANISFALKKIGVPTQEFLPKLKETFWSSNAGALFRSAMFIIQIEPSDHDSHQVLTLFATNASLYRYDALSRNDSVEHA